MDDRPHSFVAPRARASSSSLASTRSTTSATTDASTVSASTSQQHTGTASKSLLATLQPVNMRPDRYTEGMAAVAFLKKIDAIQVEPCVERSGALYYVVSVYLRRPESRIPTTVRDNQQQRAGTTPAAIAPRNDLLDRAPDFQVQHSYSEFTKLRSRAYRTANSSHGIMRCALCDDVVTATLLGSSQPKRFMNFMYSRTALAGILTDFLSGFVDIALRHRRSTGARACPGQEAIPLMLRDFLRPAREPELELETESESS